MSIKWTTQTFLQGNRHFPGGPKDPKKVVGGMANPSEGYRVKSGSDPG